MLVTLYDVKLVNSIESVENNLQLEVVVEDVDGLLTDLGVCFIRDWLEGQGYMTVSDSDWEPHL